MERMATRDASHKSIQNKLKVTQEDIAPSRESTREFRMDEDDWFVRPMVLWCS